MSCEYLGLLICSDLDIVCPAVHHSVGQISLRSALSDRALVTPRKMEAFLGLINSSALLVNLGKLHNVMLPIQHWLAGIRWDHTVPSNDLPLEIRF